MSLSSFHRLLEDVLREELLSMGLDYGEIVDSIVEKREGTIFAIRFRGERHDLDIVEPDELPTRSALAAHLRRKLETTFRRGGSTS